MPIRHSNARCHGISTVRIVVATALTIAAAGCLAAVALYKPAERGPDDKPALPAAAPAQPVIPAAWFYDELADRHWQPDHGHWHDGPPPQNAGGGDGVEAPPHIQNPTPWQYDALTNRHYDPGHAHWHAGPAPTGVDENTLVSPIQTDRVDPPPGIFNPIPWQYDEATNRHYHPGHAHWHAGSPPPPSQR